MKKAIIISCYFGTLPNYFNLFLKSCEKNSKIDFLFVTDCESQIGINVPHNFHVLPLTFDKMIYLIKSRLGSQCVCHKPYKLCDYRPAYGVLFSEHIKDYDYWGHCDCDLIFGDLEQFITGLMDKDYNKIFKYGHLTLYKNNITNNISYKKSFSGINYNYVFSHKHSFGFDEKRGMHALYIENGLSYFTDDYCLDVTVPIRYISLFKFRHGEAKIAFINQKNYAQQFVLWDNGRIFLYYIENNELKRKEYIYVHLQKRQYSSNSIMADKFIILPSSFADVTSADLSIFSRFDFEPHIKQKYKLPSVYRFHRLWYTITRHKWQVD